MKVLLANRIFKYKDKVYPDPNRELSPKDVLLFYTQQNKELCTCTVGEKTINTDGKVEYEFVQGFTPKG